jgi:hypothetical protein
MRLADRIAAIKGLDQEIATYQAEDRARIDQSQATAFAAHRIEQGIAMTATTLNWPVGVKFGGGDA